MADNIVRDDAGRFVKGYSGSRKGRTSRLVTLAKTLDRAYGITGLSEDDVLATAIRLANSGDAAMCRLMVELRWSKPRAVQPVLRMDFDSS